ncbi:MAG TPA: G/U mismatch-specific DNA glycosylase [Chitinispirillaceae bacterium]|nr:G/U mismatch-specific DNA glycosylase [Chitinispirillaceae bacterium]
MAEKPWKPNKEQIRQAAGKTVPDIIAKDLDVLFCGINPGLYTAAVQHHFARPGNRFWPTLYLSGFTPRIFSPFEEDILPSLGIGITNLVERATADASELSFEELSYGLKALKNKVLQIRPKVVAILGIGAYRIASGHRRAVIGKQQEMIARALIWVLPNPSGINASYQTDDLVNLFRNLYDFIHL